MNYNDLELLRFLVMVWFVIAIAILVLIFVFYKLSTRKKIVGKAFTPTSYLPPIETQLRVVNTKNIVVEFKGLIPNQTEANLSFVSTIESSFKTDEVLPVLSYLDCFQSNNSKNFKSVNKLAQNPIPPHSGASEWRSFCNVPVEILQAPYSGNQNLIVKSELVDDKGNTYASFKNSHKVNLTHQGYLEEDSTETNIRATIIKLAVATAFIDGEYHNNESKLIDKWILKTLHPYQSKHKIELEKLFYSTLELAEKEAAAGKIDIDSLLDEIKLGNQVLSYEALELLIDVMTADGIENKSETKFINNAANKLFVDREQLNRIKDKKISQLETPLEKGSN